MIRSDTIAQSMAFNTQHMGGFGQMGGQMMGNEGHRNHAANMSVSQADV
jgi:hypothetical protein